jgi:putative FmdB family regulatory protein
MLTYEYECTKCGHTFEILQSISSDSLTQCPKCKGLIRRLIGGGMGVIFKGSGFYTTDNKKGSSLSGGNGSSGKETKESKESKESKENKDSAAKTKSPEKPKETASEKSSNK